MEPVKKKVQLIVNKSPGEPNNQNVYVPVKASGTRTQKLNSKTCQFRRIIYSKWIRSVFVICMVPINFYDCNWLPFQCRISVKESWASSLHKGTLQSDAVATRRDPVSSTGADSNAGRRLNNYGNKQSPFFSSFCLRWSTKIKSHTLDDNINFWFPRVCLFSVLTCTAYSACSQTSVKWKVEKKKWDYDCPYRQQFRSIGHSTDDFLRSKRV